LARFWRAFGILGGVGPPEPPHSVRHWYHWESPDCILRCSGPYDAAYYSYLNFYRTHCDCAAIPFCADRVKDMVPK